MAADDYLRQVVTEIAQALGPLTTALDEPDALVDLLAALGWDLDPTVADTFVNTFAGVATAMATLAADASNKVDLATLTGDVGAVAAALVAAVPRVTDGLPPPFDQSEFWAQLPADLFELLLSEHLEARHPLTLGILAIVGIARLEARNADGASGRVAFRRRTIDLGAFADFVSAPADALVKQYGWGRTFNHHAAMWALSLLARGVRGGTDLNVLEPRLAAAYYGALSEHRSIVQRLVISGPALAADDGSAAVKAALVILPVPPADALDAAPEGLALMPLFIGRVNQTFQLGPVAKLTIGGAATASPIEVDVRPSGVSARVPPAGPEAELSVQLDIAPSDPLIIFGNADASRLELLRAHILLDVHVAAEGLAMSVEAVLDQLRLIVQADEGDHFLATVLGDKPIQADVGLGFVWSGLTGLRLAGQKRVAVDVPLSVDFGGFLQLVRLHLLLHLENDGAPAFDVGLSGNLTLGPVAVSVQNVGIRVRVRGTDLAHPGNLGVLDLGFAFKPPIGIGLSIDTPTIKAGGFLAIDIDRGRYVGAIELSVLNKFDLSAIGIITTQRPDGSPGFSLLFLISMTLPVPIPLGYNFYFAGAGGLLGLNRGVDIDHLRDGLRTGTADNILFPTDVVRRIDAIVLDLDSSFPQTQGQFLVGPMAFITWSTPPLISVKLGLVIEIGTPVRIAILGVLRAALPDSTDPVLDLKVAFLGTIDVGAKLISFDAAIFDSYIGRGSFKLLIEGDMALRVAWGNQPDFVSSIGGFHPSFTPQAHLHLPVMRRLSLSLLKDNPRLGLQLYLAVTSNTVQCGARLDFFFKVSEFSVVGDFGFDVLFQFSPFHLDARVYAALAVKAGDLDILSLRLDFNLLGPNPWIARGTASFRVLCFKVSVQFEKRFGEEETQTLPDIEVLPALIAQFSRDESWTGELDNGAQKLVVLRALKPVAGTVVIDAAGRLTVGQRILPLDTDFTLFGTSRPKDARRVGVKALRIGGVDETIVAVQDDFAPAAFRALSDSDKLAAAPFERRPSGVKANSGQSLLGDLVVDRPVAYELIVSDTKSGAVPGLGVRLPESDGATFSRLVAGGAVGRSAAAKANARLAEAGKVLDLGAARERFAVASQRDLRPLDADGKPATTTGTNRTGQPVYVDGTLLARSDAEQRRAALLAQGFAADELEIVPEAQLVA